MSFMDAKPSPCARVCLRLDVGPVECTRTPDNTRWDCMLDAPEALIHVRADTITQAVIDLRQLRAAA